MAPPPARPAPPPPGGDPGISSDPQSSAGGPRAPVFPRRAPKWGWRNRLWIPCALLSAAGFALSPEAGLAAGVASLAALFLLSPRRERDSGLLLLLLGVGLLVSARSLYPGIGTLLGGAYLLGRSRWGPGAPLREPARFARGPGAPPLPSTPSGEGRWGPPGKRREPAGLWGNRTLYELVTALGAVALVVALLQQGTATWPAMVAVESCSMEPNIRVGDLVLVLGTRRTPIATQAGDRVRIFPSGPDGGPPQVEVDHGEDADLRSFSSAPGCVAELIDSQGFSGGCRERGEPLSGDVIVFYPNGNAACTPIIHRARAWIPDNTTLAGRTFPRGGFITKGDNNGPVGSTDPLQAADQVANSPAGVLNPPPVAGSGTGGGRGACSNTQPVRPEWLVGVAQFRVPWLGYVRLLFGNSPKGCASGL